MSAPLFLPDFSPRIRNRALSSSLLALSSHSRNTQRWSKHKTLKEEILAFYARQSEGIPHIPGYLVDTVYTRLVKQQLQLFNKRIEFKADVRTGPTIAANRNLQPVLRQHLVDERIDMSFYEHIPTLNSSATGKKVPTAKEYAALGALLNRDNHNFILAIQDLRLPSAWDVRPKCDYIDVNSDNLELTYTGDGKDGTEVASVRANHAMRRQCGIYYFEIQVISKGIDGHIGIGFCRKINSLNRFPGWEEHSWGYHAENGNIYSGPGTEKSYGPNYGTGDIIGCGVDFTDMSAFYTINGIYLGTAFKNIIETDIYPFVGFKTAGEKIEANFGTKPFMFDIQQHIANEKRELLKMVTREPIETIISPRSAINPSVENNIADKVVMEYLRHHGYIKSVAALEGAMKRKSVNIIDDDSEMMHRHDIRKCIIEGDIDKAIQLCNTYYPSVLEENPLVEFRLQCRKFMEMVRRVQSNVDQPSLDEYEAQSLQVSDHRNTSTKRTISEADLESHNYKRKKQKASDHLAYSFEAVMKFGNSLKQKYGPDSEHNESMKAELLTTFSTLAYTDLTNKAIAYLFELPHIETVASELNSVILVSLGKNQHSSLGRIYRQTAVTIEELVLGGNAKAALLEPERDCLKVLDL